MRFHGVNQIFPGYLEAFSRPCKLRIFGILKVHDTALELRKAGAHILDV